MTRVVSKYDDSDYQFRRVLKNLSNCKLDAVPASELLQHPQFKSDHDVNYDHVMSPNYYNAH
jgi:hypothetical protein